MRGGACFQVDWSREIEWPQCAEHLMERLTERATGHSTECTTDMLLAAEHGFLCFFIFIPIRVNTL